MKAVYVSGGFNADKTQVVTMAWGDTYQIKEELKANGYKWNADNSMWWKVVSAGDAKSELANFKAIAKNAKLYCEIEKPNTDAHKAVAAEAFA